MDAILEGCKVSALADSGSQVNMMTPEFIQEWHYLVLLLDRLVNYPLHLVGLGGQDGGQTSSGFGWTLVVPWDL